MEEIAKSLELACHKLFNEKLNAELEPTDKQFGDYSSNIALRLAPKIGKDAKQIAEQICAELEPANFLCEVAGPGFINFKLSNQYWNKTLTSALKTGEKFGFLSDYKGQTVVVEYSDPNPFKVLHAGHFYTSVVGDAVANLFEKADAKVYRVNFGGDVGLHVAKTIYAVLEELEGEHPKMLEQKAGNDKAVWLSQMYVRGHRAYQQESNQAKIKDLNKKLYEISQKGDKTSPLGQIYWTTRSWSYDYFKQFYKQIGTHFDKFYPESETGHLGMTLVSDGLKAGVFKRSEGAVIFEGEKYGLHTRVFVNEQGLPTYETKDLGLMMAKKRDYKPNLSVIITGNEQAEYMKVVISAMQQLDASVALNTKHITHGLVKLAGGKKMSSREGNVLGAEEILKIADDANTKLNGHSEPEVSMAAVKYTFLKQRLGSDIVFDPHESLSLQGNSGPYIQYAYARAASILNKAPKDSQAVELDLDDDELLLAKKVMQFELCVQKATADMHPHHICTYLYELAGEFNRFYENNRVIGDQRQAQRLALVKIYKTAMKNGLTVLGIPAPEQLK